MTVHDKVGILADAAKYDVSCVSSGSSRNTKNASLGNAVNSGICHSWTSDGRCVSLLKILLTNHCIYDCAYCINRRSNQKRRAIFSVEEIVNLTMEFYRRNYIEGLFLSSGIFRSADYTMELILKTIQILRFREGFGGYIHVKAIPGADEKLIHRAGQIADRMSVNIELPTEVSLTKLAPDKTKKHIFSSMGYLAGGIEERKDEKSRKAPPFVPAGQSTQLIVGASPESDYHILNLSSSLYSRFKLKRVFYSAFNRVNEDKRLPVIETPPLLREHRLYQADWLLRFYGFGAGEILDENDPFLDSRIDPKTSWALRNMDRFPIEIQTADQEDLLRIPGIGQRSVWKILRARKTTRLTLDGLKKMGVVLKRARYFITLGGKREKGITENPRFIYGYLTGAKEDPGQLSLFGEM